MPSWQAKPARGTVRDRHSGLPWMPHGKATLPATEKLSWVFRIIRARVGRAARDPSQPAYASSPAQMLSWRKGARGGTNTGDILSGATYSHEPCDDFLRNAVWLSVSQKHGILIFAKQKGARMKLVDRPRYLERLKGLVGTPDIKVITGVRRAGKSKLLEAFRDYLLHEVDGASVIHADLSLLEFEGLTEYHALNDYVTTRRLEGARNFVLIDEVQMCEGFERAINSLHASGDYDIYITGSNAFLLSSDLATLFTGRTVSVDVFPFSFEEYRSYFEGEHLDDALERYLRVGGMSGGYVYGDERDRHGYLSGVYDTLILRDIVQRHGIRNARQLERLSDYMMDNVSNITSARGVADALTSAGTKANDRTISSYMSFLEEAFAFYRVRRYDVRGKRYLSSGDKHYLVDHAFRYAKLGTRNMDFGRVLENVVAIELLRRGYETYAGILYEREIDFVAMRGGEKLYIQVSDDISSPETFRREYSPLLSIRDAHPKMILARTRHETYTYEGIEVHDLARWLAKEG